MNEIPFEWDQAKDRINRIKHGIPFDLAQQAFGDPRRVILEDLNHGSDEPRFFLLGNRGWRCDDGAFHLARRARPDLWRRILA